MNNLAVAFDTPLEDEEQAQTDKRVIFVCSHVFESTRPVLLVVREHGDWTFTCGSTDHGANDSHLAGIGHMLERDPSLGECLDLLEGFEAQRTWIGVPWLRSRIGTPPYVEIDEPEPTAGGDEPIIADEKPIFADAELSIVDADLGIVGEELGA